MAVFSQSHRGLSAISGGLYPRWRPPSPSHHARVATATTHACCATSTMTLPARRRRARPRLLRSHLASRPRTPCSSVLTLWVRVWLTLAGGARGPMRWADHPGLLCVLDHADREAALAHSGEAPEGPQVREGEAACGAPCPLDKGWYTTVCRGNSPLEICLKYLQI